MHGLHFLRRYILFCFLYFFFSFSLIFFILFFFDGLLIDITVTSHQSHPCVTTSDYFVRKQADVQALLERAKVLENRLAQGVEKVDNELLSVTRNTSGVRNSLNSFFTQVLYSSYIHIHLTIQYPIHIRY